MFKKTVGSLLILLTAAFLFAGCGRADSDTDIPETVQETPAVPDRKLNIYSRDAELGERLEDVYAVYPELRERINYVNTGEEENGTYHGTIDQRLQTPDAPDYPDLIALSSDSLMKYTDSDYTLPIADCGLSNEELSEMVPYTVKLSTDRRNGTVKGLSYSSFPGAFFYREDLAEKYLGVKSPEEMQKKVNTWDEFLLTAKELKKASKGECLMLSSAGDITEVFYINKKEPWVDDNKVFHMDAVMLQYMEVKKELEQQDLTWKNTPQSKEWKKGASGDGVLGYFGSARLLNGMLLPECGGEKPGEGTFGKWKMCMGPMLFFSGGTWICAARDCADPALAGTVMRALCCDTALQEMISEETKELPNNKTAMKKLLQDGKGESAFLGGQDMIEFFTPLIDNVDVSSISAYDLKINEIFEARLDEYISGNKDRMQAVNDFKTEIAYYYPDLTVE